MKRTARVPLWASLIVPIVLSFMLGFWGVLLAAPLLAVIFAYRAVARKRAQEAAAKSDAAPDASGTGNHRRSAAGARRIDARSMTRSRDASRPA